MKTDPIALQSHCEWLGGRILIKKNGELLIHILKLDKKILAPINEIKFTFIPKHGDDVSVQIEYEISEDGTAGELLGFYAIRPLRSKSITGKIQSFKKKLSYGIIDKEYLFYMDVLQHSDNRDNMPDKGDFVDAEVISGEHDIDNEPKFHWRCIKLVKTHIGNSQNGKTEKTEKTPAAAAADSDDENDGSDVEKTCEISMTKNAQLKVSLETTNDTKSIQLIIENHSHRTRDISQVEFDHEIASSQIQCPELHRKHKVLPNGKVVYNIQVIGKICGQMKLKMFFKIDNKHKFGRCVTIHVKRYADDDTGVLQIRSPASTMNIYNNRGNVIHGIRNVQAPHFIDVRLERFDVPTKLFNATLEANNQNDLDDRLDDATEILSCHKASNYAEFFHYLLYFEEIYLRHEFRRYDQDRGHFVRDGEYLAYEMNQNIFECRPSIVVGDMIYAESLLQNKSNQSDQKSIQYQGFIHKIKRKRLLLKFDDNFHSHYQGEDYKLIFKFSRSKFDKLHNAVKRVAKKLTSDSPEYLFPTQIKKQELAQLNVKLINGNLEMNYPKKVWEWKNPNLNIYQKKAVCNVLRGEARPTPYIIFGPPGN